MSSRVTEDKVWTASIKGTRQQSIRQRINEQKRKHRLLQPYNLLNYVSNVKLYMLNLIDL